MKTSKSEQPDHLEKIELYANVLGWNTVKFRIKTKLGLSISIPVPQGNDTTDKTTTTYCIPNDGILEITRYFTDNGIIISLSEGDELIEFVMVNMDCITECCISSNAPYIECNNKNCPERENITKYIIKS